MKKNRLRSLLIFSSLVFALTAQAEEQRSKDSQIHVRTGLIAGTYEGTFDGSFSVPLGLDVTYETLMENSLGRYVRFMQAMDLPDSRPFYTYIGFGYNFYDKSKGMSSTHQESTIEITTLPKVRYYFSADIGVSQVVVKSFGSIVQAVSNMADFGVGVGGIYQLGENLGAEAHLGASFGYGFSSVAVLGYTGRALLGLTYYF